MNPDFWSERATRNNRIATVVTAVLFYAVAYALAWFAYGPALGFAVCSPILAGYLAWLLVHRADSWLFFPKWMALRKVHGNRHFFDDRPLRIEAHDGRCRIAADDLFGVLGAQASARTLSRLQAHLGEQALFQDADGTWWFEEAAALLWLKARSTQRDRRTQSLLQWLEREAFPALHRRMERGTAS